MGKEAVSPGKGNVWKPLKKTPKKTLKSPEKRTKRAQKKRQLEKKPKEFTRGVLRGKRY